MLLVQNFEILLRKHHCVRLSLCVWKMLDLDPG